MERRIPVPEMNYHKIWGNDFKEVGSIVDTVFENRLHHVNAAQTEELLKKLFGLAKKHHARVIVYSDDAFEYGLCFKGRRYKMCGGEMYNTDEYATLYDFGRSRC